MDGERGKGVPRKAGDGISHRGGAALLLRLRVDTSVVIPAMESRFRNTTILGILRPSVGCGDAEGRSWLLGTVRSEKQCASDWAFALLLL